MPLVSELKDHYRKLRNFYDCLPRDPDLSKYIGHFSYIDVIDKIYAVGPYCWFISDMHSTQFIQAGGALRQLTGFDPHEIVNRSFIKAARFASPEDLGATLQAANGFWQYFYSQPVANRTSIKSSHTYRFIRKDGTGFHALQQSSTIFFDRLGNGVYQLDLITDITHLDPIPKLRFYLLDSSDKGEMKNINLGPVTQQLKQNIPVSKSEMRVLQLIAQGKSIKIIADELGLSPNTIKHHRSNMFSKCAVKNMAELTAKALNNGWFNGSSGHE